MMRILQYAYDFTSTVHQNIIEFYKIAQVNVDVLEKYPVLL